MKKIIGYILIFPPVLSVVFFTINVFIHAPGKILTFSNLGNNWSGDAFVYGESGGAGFTSSLPIYFGLMAIAGVMLIKDSKEK